MWSGKFMSKSVIKGYNILLRDNVKTLEDDVDEAKYGRVRCAVTTTKLEISW